MSRPDRRPDPPPLRTDDVATVAAGGALWLLALIVLIALRAAGVDGVHGWWLGMCGYGLLLAALGTVYCRRRAVAIARDGAAEQ